MARKQDGGALRQHTPTVRSGRIIRAAAFSLMSSFTSSSNTSTTRLKPLLHLCKEL